MSGNMQALEANLTPSAYMADAVNYYATSSNGYPVFYLNEGRWFDSCAGILPHFFSVWVFAVWESMYVVYV